MKLYATLETSKGKVVSVSDNEQIVATVYDGNKKAYSVIIEWCNVGDPEGSESEGGKPAYGAIITTREWRNQPDEKRKGWNHCNHYATHKNGLCVRCGYNTLGKTMKELRK